MKYGLLIGCLLLAGCEKNPLNNALGGHIGRARTIGTLNVVGMGQSNMEKMNPEGLQEFTKAMSPYAANVVDTAVGGTPITMWMPGTPYFEAAMASFIHIDVVLWSQGEAETQNDGDGLGDLHNASNWAPMFTQIVREIQKRNPGCRIVFAQLGKNPEAYTPRYPGWETVRGQQNSISLANVGRIQADDLANDPDDHIHFTTDSYRQLGRRYAARVLQLLIEVN